MDKDIYGGAVSIDRIELNYDEKKKTIKANVFLDYGSDEEEKRPVKDFDAIINRIVAFALQEGPSSLSIDQVISKLIDEGRILFNTPAILNGGVIVMDPKAHEYSKVIFDKNNVSFKETRLSRMERRALGLFDEDDKATDSINKEGKELSTGSNNTSKSNETKQPIVEATPKKNTTIIKKQEETSAKDENKPKQEETSTKGENKPKQEEKTSTKDENKQKKNVLYSTTGKDDEMLSNGHTKGERYAELINIAGEIQKMNMGADIRIGAYGVDSEASYRIYSSIPLESLKIPEGYIKDSHNKGWFHGPLYTFLIYDLALADKSSLSKPIREILYPEIYGNKGKKPETKEVKQVNKDSSKEKKEDKVAVSKLRINVRRLIALAAAVLIIGGGHFFKKDEKGEEDKQPTIDYTDETRYEPAKDYPDDVIVPSKDYYDDTVPASDYPDVVEEQPAVDYTDESRYEPAKDYYFDDVDSKIQYVNDLCKTGQPCSFSDIADESDKSTIEYIDSVKNDTIEGTHDKQDLLDEYVKYVFEGSTLFNGRVVKAFDYLSPIDRYAVVVSAETMLLGYQDYNYSVGNNAYYYEKLIGMFNDQIDLIVHELKEEEFIH